MQQATMQRNNSVWSNYRPVDRILKARELSL